MIREFHRLRPKSVHALSNDKDKGYFQLTHLRQEPEAFQLKPKTLHFHWIVKAAGNLE
jgi:hypothetical protein